jgi:hypothetical protein
VDGELRLTFRRTFSPELMQKWDDLVTVVESIELRDDSDALIWCYSKSGVYDTQSFYAVINYRGITPLYIPAIWKSVVPPKIHLVLWLLAHNKLATVDNLNKKGLDKPKSCRFCEEDESIAHLFFECIVAKAI